MQKIFVKSNSKWLAVLCLFVLYIFLSTTLKQDRFNLVEVLLNFIFPFIILLIIAGPISKTTFFQSKNGYRLLFVSLVFAFVVMYFAFVGW